MARTTTEKCLVALMRIRLPALAFLIVLVAGINLFSAPPQLPPLPSFTKDANSVQTTFQAKHNRSDRNVFDNDDHEDNTNIGIVSTKDPSFFRAYREEIDAMNDEARCRRYGFQFKSGDPAEYAHEYTNRRQTPRRIFFGSLIAAEPWELFEIVASETYGIYEGFVLVESNRTQSFFARNLTHYTTQETHRQRHEQKISEMFGISPHKTQIRLFVNEDPDLLDLEREEVQRNDILNGWKALGMRPDDVGILSDLDEVLTRDFLRAIQICDVIDGLDYHSHECRPNKMGLRAMTQVYEGSPECIVSDHAWHHPSALVGHCLEGIGDSGKHPPSPRVWGKRKPGWGGVDWNESNPFTPSYNGGDFRDPGGARNIELRRIEGNDGETSQRSSMTKPKKQSRYGMHTAFHFHNFFTDGNAIRFKYKTYGHPIEDAEFLPLEDLHEDLGLMVHCARNEQDRKDAHFQRVLGGFESLDYSYFTPIYFEDADYRRRRHELIRETVVSNDAQRDEKFAEMMRTKRLGKLKRKSEDTLPRSNQAQAQAVNANANASVNAKQSAVVNKPFLQPLSQSKVNWGR